MNFISAPQFPGLYRKNNVPAWQRLHQNHHDGLRQWDKVRDHPSPESKRSVEEMKP